MASTSSGLIIAWFLGKGTVKWCVMLKYMAENHTTVTNYDVLDVRELVYTNNAQAIILICKVHNDVKRRRITIWDDDDIWNDAKVLAPGDFIVVHERVNDGVHRIVEIEY